jgi:hypothetical protein
LYKSKPTNRKSEVIYADVIGALPGDEAFTRSSQSSELSPAPVKRSETMVQTEDGQIDRESDRKLIF